MVCAPVETGKWDSVSAIGGSGTWEAKYSDLESCPIQAKRGQQ